MLNPNLTYKMMWMELILKWGLFTICCWQQKLYQYIVKVKNKLFCNQIFSVAGSENRIYRNPKILNEMSY